MWARKSPTLNGLRAHMKVRFGAGVVCMNPFAVGLFLSALVMLAGIMGVFVGNVWANASYRSAVENGRWPTPLRRADVECPPAPAPAPVPVLLPAPVQVQQPLPVRQPNPPPPPAPLFMTSQQRMATLGLGPHAR